jgi:hypothetical protein
VAPVARQPRVTPPVAVVIGMLYCVVPRVVEAPQLIELPPLHSVMEKLTTPAVVPWTINGNGLLTGQVVSTLAFMQPIKRRLASYTSTLYMPKMLPSSQLVALPRGRQPNGSWPLLLEPSYRATGKAGLEQVVPVTQLTTVPPTELRFGLPDPQAVLLAWQPAMVLLAPKTVVG